MWDFIQNEILGMKWLYELILRGVAAAGLPLGVTFSFLISSPMVDLGSLVVLMSVFGWKTAVLYVVFGLVIAVAGGSLIEKLHLEGEIADFILNARNGGKCGNCGQAELPEMTFSMKERVKSAFDKMLETLKKLFPYILAGVALGAFIHNWIPEGWITSALGSKNPFGVLIAVLCGVPMYADIFGCIPIAEALLFKGAALGVVLSFMMAVTTLSLPSLVMLSKAVKPKLLAIFTAICVVGIIAAGYLFNVVQSVQGWM